MLEENKALTRRVLEDLVVKMDLEKIDEYFAADVIVHVPFLEMPPGRQGIRMLYSSFPDAIADVDLRFEDQIAEGDRVVTRWSSAFTHTGDLCGGICRHSSRRLGWSCSPSNPANLGRTVYVPMGDTPFTVRGDLGSYNQRRKAS